MADGDEITEDFVADVGPLLEYFLGGGPSLVPDLAGSEKTPAAPASFDVLDAFEQLGGPGALFIDAAHLSSVSGDVPAAAALWMAQHGEKAARDVDDLQVVLICFLQDRQIAILSARG